MEDMTGFLIKHFIKYLNNTGKKTNQGLNMILQYKLRSQYYIQYIAFASGRDLYWQVAVFPVRGQLLLLPELDSASEEVGAEGTGEPGSV